MDEPKKKGFKMPHSYVILGIIILLAALMTWVIPAGQYTKVEDPATGRMVVDPSSYATIPQQGMTPMKVLMSIPQGMISAADIIFFIIFAYGLVFIMLKTGAITGALGTLVRALKGRTTLVIPILMAAFGVLGSCFGLLEEVLGLIPAFMLLAIALGYDALVGFSIVFVGVATGFAAGTTNPFTIGVSQGIAGVPLFSGVGYRIIIWFVFMSVAIWYTMRYAKKVKNDPQKSLLKGVRIPLLENTSSEEIAKAPFELRHKLSMLVFAVVIGFVIYGTMKLGWFMVELSAVFMLGMFAVGFINKFGVSKICEVFVEASKSIIFGALVVGISRAIVVVLTRGAIIDTIVYSLASVMQNFSQTATAAGMLVFQTILNFFIPSGTGQAATSMPIMAPLADAVGMSRQIAVLAFHMGEGMSNMLWPTTAALVCGFAGVPINKWYKFFAPLFCIFFVFEIIFMAGAVLINFS